VVAAVFVLQLVLFQLAEEIEFTGFLQHHWQDRYHPMELTLYVALLWALWHIPDRAGFFQTRLEARFNFVIAAVVTALPFAGVHVPLLLLDDQLSALFILIGIAGLLILGIVVRLLMGVTRRAASDSVLAVGILHQIFDASNNNGGLVDSLLDGADAGNMTQLADAVLTVLIAAWLLLRHPGAFAKRQIPLPDSPPAVG
jgi:membrane protease YdiL (CAAX protease family)